MFSPWRMDGGMAAPWSGFGIPQGIPQGIPGVPLPQAWPVFPGYTPSAIVPAVTGPGLSTGPLPLRGVAAGAFPVPEAISPEQLPAAAKDALLRVIEAPPKPVVSHRVMDEAQSTMIAPDLPFRSNI